jgi:hypothetical protein
MVDGNLKQEIHGKEWLAENWKQLVSKGTYYPKN